MYHKMLLVLFFSVLLSHAVKIGISKPATIAENGTTTTPIQTTTVELVTTTTTQPTTTVKTTKPTTQTPSTTIRSSTSSTSTSITTTTVPPTTTSMAPNNNTAGSTIRNSNFDYSGYFCNCDLRHHVCEINCCCDIDCIPEEVNVFDCRVVKTRLEDFHYQQGLPPCKINEGWLCVFRNNYDDSKRMRIEYKPDMAAIQRWPQLLLEPDDTARERGFYKFGEPIFLYNLDANDVLEYDVPYSIVGERCQVFDSIRHLTPRKTSCHTTLEQAQSLETTLFQKLRSSFILQRPNVEIPQDGSIKDELIPISLYHCSSDVDCIPTLTNSSLFDLIEETEFSSAIRTKIFHNITDILACEVFFTRSSPDTDVVWQHYFVDFIHINETSEVPLNVSGPLGYIPGNPLIIAQKVLFNQSLDHTESNLVLSYFHPLRMYSIHMHTPRRRNNHCEESKSTVNFGESLQSQCTVQLDNSTELNTDSNYTKICCDLQSRIDKFLQIDEILELENDFFVSKLGYPVNKSDDWIKIEVRNYDYLPVQGTFLEKEYAFICQNMILGVTYEFLTISDDVRDVRHQNILKRAVVDVGRRHDLQFELEEVISIPVSFSVVFQDLHQISGGITIREWSLRIVVLGLLVVVCLTNKLNSIS